MLDKLFKEYLNLSAKYRPDYPKSLGSKKDSWIEIFNSINHDVPKLYRVIYESVSGTRRDIKRQELMDFVPGYRLIHIDELIEEKKNLDSMLKSRVDGEFETMIPLLANYSSDFVCYARIKNGREYIVRFLHDDYELGLMHESIEAFFETICEFYNENVYYLDEDGYLDYDLHKECEIGSKKNVGLDYWLG